MKTKSAKHHPALGSSKKLEKFREMLFKFSTELISVPPPKIDRMIEKMIARVGGFFGFEWVFIGVLLHEKNEPMITHSYSAPVFAQPEPTVCAEDLPWFISEITQNEPFLMSSLPDQLPEDAKKDRNFCVVNGIKYALILRLPTLSAGQSMQKALFMFSTRKKSPTTDDFIKLFKRVGEILANALERKRAAKRVNELFRFEHILSEISNTYINLPGKDFEKRIKNDLKRVGEFLRADRCVLHIKGPNWKKRNIFDFSYVWDSQGNDSPLSLDSMAHRNPEFKEFFNEFSKHVCKKLDELPEKAWPLKNDLQKLGVKSFLHVPVSYSGSLEAVVVLASTRVHHNWFEELIPRLRLFGEIFANALVRKQTEEKLQDALSEIKLLKERIEADYIYLREEIKHEHSFGGIVGKSDALKRILVKVEQVAYTNATVLILGETGTGKSLIARAVHNTSKRKDRPLMQINCATLTPSLIESELFGHEKGAFTGAAERRIGRFEAAHGTTLFLDEIGDLPLELQPKLLRVLQDNEFERVGGSVTIKTDVRVIAATNRDLVKEVEAGRFRRDLWYRLTIFPISVPPLRERKEDIPLFVSWFVDNYANEIGKHFERIPHKTIKALQNYSWPGNIRELKNIIERAVISSPNGNLHIEMPEAALSGHSASKETLEAIEREHILKIVKESSWKISGPNGAAQRLNVNPSTLRSRMKKLHIKQPV